MNSCPNNMSEFGQKLGRISPNREIGPEEKSLAKGPVVLLSKPEFAHFSPRALLQHCLERKIKVNRIEVIPLADVMTEEAIVDTEHADDLADSIAESEQLTPIGTRINLTEEGRLVYDIFDGFHRTAGQKRKNREVINATVRYGCSDEELYDLRVLAASSVRSVQFARQAEWITKTFSLSKWADSGLTVSQVFGLAVNDRASTYLVKIPPEQFQELKDWARAKARKWKKPVTSVYQLLRVVENADPDLVRQVRSAGGLRDHAARITQDRLASVVEVFPVQVNKAAQRAVLAFVTERKFYADVIPSFARRMASVLTPDLTEEEMTRILSNLDDKQLAELMKEDNEGNNSIVVEFEEATPIDENGNGRHKEEIHPLDKTHETASLDLLEIDEISPNGDDSSKPKSLIGHRSISYQEPTLDVVNDAQYSKLLQDNHALRAALRSALRGEGIDPSLLFRTTALPPLEREIVEGLFIKFRPFADFCLELRKTPAEVVLSLQSALARYHGEEQDLRQYQDPNFIEQAEDNQTSLW